MKNENGTQRARLRGYMFEIVISVLIEKCGFIEVNERNDKIRESRDGFTEVRGRGTWHEIDCLYDYRTQLPFMYPIRMLGEVKFYNKPLHKGKIREYIAVIKDIRENYFVDDNFDISSERVSELGVYFSANGFEIEAL